MAQLRNNELTPERIGELLDTGHMLTGPGSDQHDTLFSCEAGKYVYRIIGYGSMRSQTHHFEANERGLFDMLLFACFHGSHCHPKEDIKYE